MQHNRVGGRFDRIREGVDLARLHRGGRTPAPGTRRWLLHTQILLVLGLLAVLPGERLPVAGGAAAPPASLPVLAVGAGPDPVVAREPAYRTVQGLRLAVLARSAVPNNPPAPESRAGDPSGPALLDPTSAADLADLAADLRAARAEADVVILLM